MLDVSCAVRVARWLTMRHNLALDTILSSFAAAGGWNDVCLFPGSIRLQS